MSPNGEEGRVLDRNLRSETERNCTKFCLAGAWLFGGVLGGWGAAMANNTGDAV